ncbi:hypothetical protein SKAU_G00259830 [Synaphobranchus kaupii]|uniref:T-cell surface glycoprotein CD3 zeta chain n=1 Tax=Synaphobranchus kaupii TaxID=118154 RepID=A0A9Q1F4H2_SYNKA|nr:hypothetical protein SKAU_G00259830 [Synaphobranchus kaupii]
MNQPNNFREAKMGINDPALCYILDAVLLLYGLIITALFFRERFFKPKDNSKDEGICMVSANAGLGNMMVGLNKPADTYDVLRVGKDAESGATGPRGNRRQAGDETYTALQKVTEDDYKEIAVKKQRRRNKKDEVYQDLSNVTMETYDDPQRKRPLPPR